MIQNNSGSDLTPSDLEFEDAVPDSSSTEIYSEHNITEDTIHEELSRTDNPIAEIEMMWHQDALTKRWHVPVRNLTKAEIYNLSHAPPNWENMDPYSSLNETSCDSLPNKNVTFDTLTTLYLEVGARTNTMR